MIQVFNPGLRQITVLFQGYSHHAWGECCLMALVVTAEWLADACQRADSVLERLLR